MQLGILNVIQAMELAPELVYPLYIAASVDWYALVRFPQITFAISYLIHLTDIHLLVDLFVDYHVIID